MLSALFTDKINDGLSAHSAGEVQDLRHLLAIGEDGMIGAPRARQLKRLGRAIHHDNFSRRQRFETLDADMTQAPGANDDYFRPRIEARRGLFDGMVSR